MYTFYPLADVPVDHAGFWIICFIVSIPLIITLMGDFHEFLLWFFFGTIIVTVAYGVSYHLLDQTTKTYRNEKVIGEFGGYAPEGYREKTGKQYADRHFVYVVYKVNGNPILLHGRAGVMYPDRAILYKN